MSKQCCCGRIEPCDEAFMFNNTVHEPLGPDGNFCGPYVSHRTRDLERVLATMTDERNEWERRANDALAIVASVADTVNQELRENGPLDVKQYGMSMEIRDGVRLLVDLVRARLRAPVVLTEGEENIVRRAEENQKETDSFLASRKKLAPQCQYDRGDLLGLVRRLLGRKEGK